VKIPTKSHIDAQREINRLIQVRDALNILELSRLLTDQQVTDLRNWLADAYLQEQKTRQGD
jgi:hypothetical protein